MIFNINSTRGHTGSLLVNKKKKTMQVGNEFENKGESITGDEHIANGFNNYFVIVGPSLADNIPASY